MRLHKLSLVCFLLLIAFSCSEDETNIQIKANFDADQTTIKEGESVSFTDLSLGKPTSWNWNFEGGSPASSSEQNPTVSYQAAGTYQVTLTVSKGASEDTETKTAFIVVEAIDTPPVNTAPICGIYGIDNNGNLYVINIDESDFYLGGGVTVTTTKIAENLNGSNGLATNTDLGLLYFGDGTTMSWYDLTTGQSGVLGNLSSLGVDGEINSGGASYANGYLYVAPESTGNTEIYRIGLSTDGKSMIGATNITNGNLPNYDFGDFIIEGQVGNEIIYAVTTGNFWSFSVNTQTLTVIRSTDTNTYTDVQMAFNNTNVLGENYEYLCIVYGRETGYLGRLFEDGAIDGIQLLSTGLFTDFGNYYCQ